MDDVAQTTREARLTIVIGLNFYLAAHALSAVIPPIVAVIIDMHSKIYILQIAANVVGFIVALWWRSTYV